jgi:hypothetical protein
MPKAERHHHRVEDRGGCGLGTRMLRYSIRAGGWDIRNLCSKCTLLVIALHSATPTYAGSEDLDRLVAAYPNFLVKHDGSHIFWKDGSSTPISPRTNDTFDEKLKHATLEDQLSLRYQRGRLSAPPTPNDDAGRFRNTDFFDKMYGDCKKGRSAVKLVDVQWLDKANGHILQVSPLNGVAEKLRSVSEDILKLPRDLWKYVSPSAGTYNCRTVKDTGTKSMHAWGAAIDINTNYSDYWLWGKGKPYRNRIPYEIVEIFERHGFIWGGKWAHYDTMHFEYRPELLR